jgi:UDP-N-acetyl-D-mannosaminuronate dehydrogenase
VVILTNHSAYDWQHVIDHANLIVDTRHVTPGFANGKTRVVPL